MKAIVLSCYRNRPLVEHMLLTYKKLCPGHPFTFRIPYQENRDLPVGLGPVELVKTPLPIKQTVLSLISDLPDNDWVYWCIDDKFLIEINPQVATHLVASTKNTDDTSIAGVLFCRCRGMCGPPHVSREPVFTTNLGIKLLRRFDFNQIWLHQLLRVKVLRTLFESFPDYHFRAIEMDTFTEQGPSARKLPPGQIFYVTEQNFKVLGESTRDGRLTKTCINSLNKYDQEIPDDFEIIDDEVRLGGCSHLPTKDSICLEFK